MKRTVHIAIVSALIGFCTASQANISVDSIGLTSADQTVDFESVPLVQNDSVTTQFSSFGVTFTGAYANPDLSPLFPNMSGNRIGNFRSGIGDSPFFTLDFASGLSQAAFALVTAEGTTTFQALLDGVVVETASFATSSTDSSNVFAFSNIVFDQIAIRVESFDRAFLLDNLQTVAAVAAPVPEPETWALLLAGLWSVGEVARRRRTLRQQR